MRISYWSSDVCSSDLLRDLPARQHPAGRLAGNLRAPLRRRAIDTRRRRSPDHEEPTAHAGRTAAHRSAARVAHFEGAQALIAIDLSGKVAVARKRVVLGKRVSVRVVIGGRRILKKKTKTKQY